jgi:diguanylate cyclase (GGDEF)-like protein/PAS domain S-box-containing protein
VHDITERKAMEQQLALSKLKLHAILDNMPFAAWLKDTDGRYLSVNHLHAQRAGLGHPANVVGKTDAEIWHKELSDKYRAEDLSVMATGGKWQGEEIRSSDGNQCWYQTVKVAVINDRGEIEGTAGYEQDITTRKLNEASMLLAASIYQHSAEAIMVTDEHNLIVDVNPAFTRITGYELAEIRGQSPDLLQSGQHDDELYRQMWHAILTCGHWQGELWDRRKNGELYAKWLNITLIRREDGSVLRHVAQFSDITQKKKNDELIWQYANFDTLTGLPNRRLFRDRLEQEIKKAHRAECQLELLFIDLDHFKQINDTLGHDKGDLLLIEAARRITACVREADTVARLGGDEFTVILPVFSDLLQIERIAQNIINQLSQTFTLGAESADISASIGITLYSESAPDADKLLRRADQAMYVAKAGGRNRFGYFADPMQHNARPD